jgi:hypothetical protein
MSPRPSAASAVLRRLVGAGSAGNARAVAGNRFGRVGSSALSARRPDDERRATSDERIVEPAERAPYARTHLRLD